MPSPRVLASTAAALSGAAAVLVAAATASASFAPLAALACAAAGMGALAAFAAARAGSGRRSDEELLAGGVLGCEAVACFTVDREGRVVTWSRGAELLFGWAAADRTGRPAAELAPGDAQQELLAEAMALFETGKAHPAHRCEVTDRDGQVIETVCVLVPLFSGRRVKRVAVLHIDPHAPELAEGQWHRLFHAAPAGLMRIGGDGKVEALNRRLAEWVGRRIDALEGADVARAEFFPPDFRATLVAASRERAPEGTPGVPAESSVRLVGADGLTRAFTAFVARRPVAGADVALVEGASRERLLAERDAARAAAAAARESATATVTTQRGLTTSVEQLMSALEAAHAEEPGRRASAEQELERTGRRLLADVVRLEEGARREKKPAGPGVLLVDDNDENRELIAHMFRTRGADVTEVASGREAVDAIARAWFDIVLLDLQMPEMDGYEVVRRIRALPGGESVSVIALTALGSDAVRDRCLAEGMDDFVGKPITLARIQEILARWGRRGAPQPRG